MSNRNATVKVNTQVNTGGITGATNALNGFDSGLKGVVGNLSQFKGAFTGLAVIGIAKGIKALSDEMYSAFVTQWKAEREVNDALYSNMTARGESQKAIDNEVKAYKSLASALQNVGVIGDEVTLSGMGIMTRMGLTARQVKDITPLIQDLAVKQYGLNVSVEQFKEISQSVSTMVNMGKLTLQGYGIQVTDTERAQFKLMSQSERYAFIMDKLKTSVAGANEAMAKTTDGKLQQMTNAIGDCEEKVGQLVNTIYGGFATMVLPVVTSATGAFQEYMDVLNGNEPPDGGYNFISADDAINLQLMVTNLAKVSDSLNYIFDGHLPTFSEGFGVGEFLEGLADIANEVSYIADVIAKVKYNISVIDNEGLYTNNVIDAFSGVSAPIPKGTANGSNYWQGGPTWVNEYGPELIDLPRGSSIKTNAQTRRELSNGGATVNCPIIIQGNVIGNDDFIDEVGNAIYGRVSLAMSNM